MNTAPRAHLASSSTYTDNTQINRPSRRNTPVWWFALASNETKYFFLYTGASACFSKQQQITKQEEKEAEKNTE